MPGGTAYLQAYSSPAAQHTFRRFQARRHSIHLGVFKPGGTAYLQAFSSQAAQHTLRRFQARRCNIPSGVFKPRGTAYLQAFSSQAAQHTFRRFQATRHSIPSSVFKSSCIAAYLIACRCQTLAEDNFFSVASILFILSCHLSRPTFEPCLHFQLMAFRAVPDLSLQAWMLFRMIVVPYDSETHDSGISY